MMKIKEKRKEGQRPLFFFLFFELGSFFKNPIKQLRYIGLENI